MRWLDRTTWFGLIAAVVLAGCSAAPTRPASRPNAPAISSPVSAPALITPPASTPRPASHRHGLVYFADVVTRNFVVMAVGPGPQGGRGVRLVTITDAGRRFHDIGPRVGPDQAPDSLFFLNRRVGWFAVYGDGGGSETIYRTRDGGRSWHSFPAPSHVLASATGDVMSFANREDGWLSDIEETGPAEMLHRTRDGGRTWHLVAASKRIGKAAVLPRFGTFTATAVVGHGWMGAFSGGLPYVGHPFFETFDGGRTWRRAAVPVARAEYVGSPSIFGNTVVEPVVHCGRREDHVRVFVSKDDGEHWSATGGTVAFPDVHGRSCGTESTSFPSPAVGWVAEREHGRVGVERTTDGARSWQRNHVPVLRTHYAPTIEAIDGSHALLVVAADGPGNRVYLTSDGGRTWRRIDQRVVAS